VIAEYDPEMDKTGIPENEYTRSVIVEIETVGVSGGVKARVCKALVKSARRIGALSSSRKLPF
jgi:hypothetical protein